MNIRMLLVFMLCSMTACDRHESHGSHEHGVADGDVADGEFERGPHGGRLLRDGEFALEVTVYESGVAPELRLFVFRRGNPLPPESVKAVAEVKRLDGEVNRFEFLPEGSYLRANGVLEEPHSFDVTIRARAADALHEWTYASHEGRTTIAAAVARDAGVKVETAGEAMIRDTLPLMGAIALDGDRHAAIKARFEGTVREVHVRQGDRVKRGQKLLLVEGNESLRSYPITAPFDGVVLSRQTNIGDVTNGATLLEIADLSRVWVDLHALGESAQRIRSGQKVIIRSATSDLTAQSTITSLLPVATRGQSVIARAIVDNAEGAWRPGMSVSADIVVSERAVPLAVRETGLQRFRDFTVVFARVGDTYEVRMLELGARDGAYAEVLSGLKPGTLYVTEQSFLIKADVEKSGAAHDH